jgi:hypothetical protein
MPFIHLFRGFPPAYPSNVHLDLARDHHIPSCSPVQGPPSCLSNLPVMPLLDNSRTCTTNRPVHTYPRNPSMPDLTTDIYAQTMPPATLQEAIPHVALEAAISKYQPHVLFRPIPLARHRPFAQQCTSEKWWQGEVRYRILHVFANQIRQIDIGDLIEFEEDEAFQAQAGVLYSLIGRSPVPGYTGPGVCFVAAPWGPHPQVQALEVVFFHPFESEVDQTALIAMRQPILSTTPAPEPQTPPRTSESSNTCLSRVWNIFRCIRAARRPQPTITTFPFPFHHIRQVEERK